MALRCHRLLARCQECSLSSCLAEALHHSTHQQSWLPQQQQEPRTKPSFSPEQRSIASLASAACSSSSASPWAWHVRSSLHTATAEAAGPRTLSHNQQQQQQQQQRQPGQVRSSATLEQQEQQCWSCHNRFSKGGVVCSGCDKIQPLDMAMNYFQLLGMPSMQYNLDLAQLEQRYKRLQWKVHPDRLMARPAQEQQYSADVTMHINMAYSVLRNPLSRANYMLAQRGILTEKQSEATFSDPEYLEEVMEAQEAVEEAEDVDTLMQLLSENKDQQRDVVQRLGRAFDSPSGSREALDLTVRLTYLARLEAQILSKLPTDPGDSLPLASATVDHP